MVRLRDPNGKVNFLELDARLRVIAAMVRCSAFAVETVYKDNDVEGDPAIGFVLLEAELSIHGIREELSVFGRH